MFSSSQSCENNNSRQFFESDFSSTNNPSLMDPNSSELPSIQNLFNTSDPNQMFKMESNGSNLMGYDNPELAIQEGFNIQPNNTNIMGNKKNKKKWLYNSYNSISSKKPKLVKMPVYKENVSPIQTLHDFYPNLEFKYDEEKLPIETRKTRYICNVVIQSGENLFTFSGDGLSKKEAKKNCCILALTTLFADSYHPPVNDKPNVTMNEPRSLAVSTVDINSTASASATAKSASGSLTKTPAAVAASANEKKESSNKTLDIKKRIAKILDPINIRAKSASQVLHEFDLKISETGKVISEFQRANETGGARRMVYCYQYSNIYIDMPEKQALITDAVNEIMKNLPDAYIIGQQQQGSLNQSMSDMASNPFDMALSQVLNDSKQDASKNANQLATLNDGKLSVIAYGRSKKDAKNLAARDALKKFFNCDIELILASSMNILKKDLNPIKFVKSSDSTEHVQQ